MVVKDQEVPCFIWVQDLGHFVCIVRKINNMMLCVNNNVNMFLCDVLTWKL